MFDQLSVIALGTASDQSKEKPLVGRSGQLHGGSGQLRGRSGQLRGRSGQLHGRSGC